MVKYGLIMEKKRGEERKNISDILQNIQIYNIVINKKNCISRNLLIFILTFNTLQTIKIEKLIIKTTRNITKNNLIAFSIRRVGFLVSKTCFELYSKIINAKIGCKM